MIFNPLGTPLRGLRQFATSYGAIAADGATAVPSFSATVTPSRPNTPSIPAERPTASPISATGPTNGSSATTTTRFRRPRSARRVSPHPAIADTTGPRPDRPCCPTGAAFHVVRRSAFPSVPARSDVTIAGHAPDASPRAIRCGFRLRYSKIPIAYDDPTVGMEPQGVSARRCSGSTAASASRSSTPEDRFTDSGRGGDAGAR